MTTPGELLRKYEAVLAAARVVVDVLAREDVVLAEERKALRDLEEAILKIDGGRKARPRS